MELDFHKEEGRKNYLTAKFDDLLVGINESYGKSLMDELVARLENTIKEFNEEVNQMMLQLAENLKRKEQLLQNIKTGNSEPDQSSESEPVGDNSMSDWEKRLETIGK